MSSVPPLGLNASCGAVTPLLGTYLDGQLDASHTIDIDEHLAHCETCRERIAIDRAIRGSLKHTSRQGMPEAARTRILAALEAELMANAIAPPERITLDPVATGEPAPQREERGTLRSWRTLLPLASAAALIVGWGVASQRAPSAGESASRLDASFGADDLMSQLVDVHRRPLRPETPDPKEVRAFEREVGVPVHVPKLRENARFVGGRLLPVRGGERAAMLQYEVPQSSGAVERVSVFIYDPRRVPIGSSERLAPRAIGRTNVRIGKAQGYSFAVAQHGDVGYAVASDLEDSSAQYAVAADRD